MPYKLTTAITSPILKWIGLILTGVLVFFEPIMGLVWIIIACIGFDLITAIARDIKIAKDKAKAKKEDITIDKKARVIRSHKIKRSALKFIFYIIFIGLIFGIEFCFFSGGTILLPKIAAGMIVFGELVSITANLDIVMGTTLFTRILNRIRKIFQTKVESVITDDFDKKE